MIEETMLARSQPDDLLFLVFLGAARLRALLAGIELQGIGFQAFFGNIRPNWKLPAALSATKNMKPCMNQPPMRGTKPLK